MGDIILINNFKDLENIVNAIKDFNRGLLKQGIDISDTFYYKSLDGNGKLDVLKLCNLLEIKFLIKVDD